MLDRVLINRQEGGDSQDGFTLVELLVAMTAAVVVIFALSNVFIATMRGTQRTFTRVDATRQGRNAIADIENELHSACVGGNATPIQAGSTANSLAFLSYYGSAASPTPIWHVLTYNPTASSLTDASYSVTGSAPDWQPGSLTGTNTLLTNVTQRTSAGTAIPVFQYFAYSPGSSDAYGTYWFIQDGQNADPQTGTISAANPLADASGLTATAAAQTVEVMINLSVGATSESLNNPTLSSVNDQVDDAVSLRLTTPPDETSATVASGAIPPGYGPCQ